jgi:hypothetical protein
LELENLPGIARTARTPALAALILPASSFYLWKNRKAGREEEEKSG